MYSCHVNVLVAGGFTILGVLIGGAISFFTARSTRRHQHYNDAASTFRSAFADTIFELHHAQQDVFQIVTQEVRDNQERELIKFEQFTTTADRVKLRQAWGLYIDGSHSTAPGSLFNRPGEIRKVISNIEALMQCAMPK